MSRALTLRNRQRSRRLDLRLLRRIARCLLEDLLARPDYEIGIAVVGAPAMARLNEQFLSHQGSTDVITFDYSAPSVTLAGDIVVCIDDAISQARRFRTSWQSELARYVVHGVLHLSGYDDQSPAARRQMKARENRLLGVLTRRFHLAGLAK